jgi:hypothetical protein
MLARTRRLHLRRALTLTALLGVFGSQGCALLEPVGDPRCGDGVLDPSTEECDRPNGDRCGKASTANACRLIADAQGVCEPGRVLARDGERCLAPSGQFEAVGGVVGHYPVGVADFDADGRLDLLVEDGPDRRAVFFGDDGPVEPSVFLGPAGYGDWPIIDANGDAFADVLVTTSTRDAIGTFLGAADRTFFPRFQSSLPLPQGTRRLIDPLTGELVPATSLRSLAQVAAITRVNGETVVCRLFTGAPCQQLNVASIAIEDPETALITSPFFVDGSPDAETPFDEEPRFLITAADKGGAGAFRVSFPLDASPQATAVTFYPQAFANAGDECEPNICGGACPHPCETLTNIRVEAIVDLEDGPLAPFTLFAGTYGSPDNRKVMLFFMSAREPSGTAFPLLSAAEARVVEEGTEIDDVLLPDLNGDGFPELVVTSNLFGSLSSQIVILGPIPAELTGPSGRLATGDVNADGYDDLIGVTGSSIEGFDTRGEIVFGGPTLPLVTTTFDIAGDLPSFTIGDLDGDGIGDVVTTSRVPSEDGGETSELEISFGRPFSTPEPPRSLGQADIRDVLPARLQLLSNADDLGAPADAVGDLVILKNKDGEGSEASFLVGDTKRLPSSPVYVRPRVKDALALTNEPIFVGAILSVGSPDDTVGPPGEGAPAVAVVNVLKFIEDTNANDEIDDSSIESWVVQVSSEDGVIELEPGAVSLGSKVLFDRPIVLGRDATSVTFAIVTFDLASPDGATPTAQIVLFRSQGATLEQLGEPLSPPLPFNFFAPGRPGKDGALDSLLVLSTDLSSESTLEDRLLELRVEADALVAGEDVALGKLVTETVTTGLLRLGPDALQVGEAVLSLTATLEEGAPIEEECVAPFFGARGLYTPSLEADLVGDALPDVVIFDPLEVFSQSPALTCGVPE